MEPARTGCVCRGCGCGAMASTLRAMASNLSCGCGHNENKNRTFHSLLPKNCRCTPVRHAATPGLEHCAKRRLIHLEGRTVCKGIDACDSLKVKPESSWSSWSLCGQLELNHLRCLISIITRLLVSTCEVMMWVRHGHSEARSFMYIVSNSFLLLLVTSATLVVTGALLVVTRSY